MIDPHAGSAVVEFALVLPLLLVVALSLVQVGLLVRDRLLIEAAARAGARTAAVEADEGAVRAAALAAAPDLDPSLAGVAIARQGTQGDPVTVSDQLRRGRSRAPDRLALRVVDPPRRERHRPSGVRVRSERGSVSIVVAAIVVLALVFSLGVTDVARVLVARSHARTAADAAALAAAQELALPSGADPADIAAGYAERNGAVLNDCVCAAGTLRCDGDRGDRRRRVPAGHGSEDGHGPRPRGRGRAGRSTPDIAIRGHGSAHPD